jgi:hypothetical protein
LSAMASLHPETFLVPAISLAVFGLLLGTISTRAQRTATGCVVQYGWPFKMLAVISGLITLLFSVVYFFVAPLNRPAVLILIALFAVITLPLLLMVFFTRVEAEDQLMIVHSPWRRTRRIPFADVESVRFAKARQRYEVRTRTHGKVCLHIYLSGIPDLLGVLAYELEREAQSTTAANGRALH